MDGRTDGRTDGRMDSYGGGRARFALVAWVALLVSRYLSNATSFYVLFVVSRTTITARMWRREGTRAWPDLAWPGLACSGAASHRDF